MTLLGKVLCSPACDLRGHTLLVKDQTGADAGRAEISEFDGVTNATGEFVVKVPIEPGEYTWLAVSPAVTKGDVSYIHASAGISFTVKPHATHVVAWDTPSSVVVGERFRIKVGIKCPNQCDLTNKDFGVYDHDGAHVGSGRLTGARWPGTGGLFFAEVELEAPVREGLYTWSVKFPGSDVGISHAEGTISFGVRVVNHPEYVVTVETVDKDNQTALSGARVVMHPYRAVTDERGIAEVRVAKGTYQLFVSETKYVTFDLPIEVMADMTVKAELELKPVPERN